MPISNHHGLGSVRQLINASNAVQLIRHYDPYGNVWSTTGTATTAYGFAGEWTDASGMQYLRARYYAPSTGRFITRDSWDGSYIKLPPPTGGGSFETRGFNTEVIGWPDYTRPQTLNGWSYVENDPLNRIDPSGHQSVKCVDTPTTSADNTDLFDSCETVSLVKSYRTLITRSALQHGVPPELVAGILASEIDFDYPQFDVDADATVIAAYQVAHHADIYSPAQRVVAWAVIKAYLSLETGAGPASIHYDTWERAQQYYQGCGYELGELLAPGGQTLTQSAWTEKVLIGGSGTIEAVSVIGRYLADYRKGTDGQPLKTTHYTDLTPTDMAQIFGAYRNGAGGLNCFTDADGDGDYDCGFRTIRQFQTKLELGDQARQAFPYFVYFQEYFGWLAINQFSRKGLMPK